MTLQSHCRLLLKFRAEGIRLGTFMGVRWFVMKAIMLAISLAMVLSADAVARTVGLIVLGFALGMIAAGIRSYIVTGRAWVVQKDLLDWHKIEACAKGIGS